MYQDTNSPSISYHGYSLSNQVFSRNVLFKKENSSIDNLIHSVENKVSQWFWRGISALPKEYFNEDFTKTNFLNKNIWEGIFYDRLNLLQEQLIAESAENNLQPHAQLQTTTDVKFVTVGNLKEQMAAGLPQSGLSLSEQLIGLQGLVGKYTLSPQCYEQGLDSFKSTLSSNLHYLEVVEKIKEEFRESLKNQPEFLIECFQGDVFSALKEQSQKATSFKKIIDYYKPLMKRKVFSKKHSWLMKCYDTQTLLPIPEIGKHRCDPSLSKNSLNIEYQQNSLTWQYSIKRFGESIWKNAGKLVTLGLTAKVVTAQALGTNGTGYESFSEAALAPKSQSLFLPDLGFNQTASDFKLLPTPLLNSLLSPMGEASEMRSTTSIVPTLSQSDINEILLQFDKINTDLQEISEIFVTDETLEGQQHNHTIRSRVARSPFTQRTQCNISIDKLNGLKSTIDNQLSGSSIPQTGNSRCEYSSDSNNCNELVKLIQCGINQLKDKFVEVSSKSIPYHEFVKLKNAYNDLNKIYNNVKDDLTRSVSQEYQEKIDQLENSNQSLSNALNKAVKELKEKTIIFCISEIHSGRIDSSVSTFNDLKENTLLSSIVEKSYNYLSDTERSDRDKKLDNFDNIVEFIRKLPLISHGAVGYTELYKLMESNNHLNSPKMLILSELIKEYISMSNYINISQEDKNKFSSLKSSLKTDVDEIILGWSNKVRSVNYEQIVLFPKGKSYRYNNVFHIYLPDIIKVSYSNSLSNVENILTFVRDMPYIEHYSIALSCLFDGMKNNNHLDSYQLLMLAFRVKESQEMPNYPNIQQRYKDNFESIKGNLTQSVIYLTWHNHQCTIKNYHFGSNLCASKISYDEDRRRVFSCINSEDYPRWVFEPINNAKYFRIKNYDLGEYLYAAGDYFNYDKDRRRVFTWKKKNSISNGEWRITPSNGELLIFNTHYKDYLYAADMKYDNNHREIFTWIPGNNIYQKGKWKAECCTII